MRTLLSALAALTLLAAGCNLGTYDPNADPNGNGAGSGGTAGGGAGSGSAGNGGGGGDPCIPGSQNAKPTFVAQVAPLLSGKCSGGACHSAPGTSPLKFLVPTDNDQTYTIMTNLNAQLLGSYNKANAQLINKIIPGPHSAVTYTEQEAQAIRDWLDAEVALRNAVPPPECNGGGGAGGAGGAGGTGGAGGGTAQVDIVAEWSGCMDLAEWDQIGVAVAWANKNSNQGQCQTCHVNGAYGFIASPNSQLVFDTLTQNAPYMFKYFAADYISDPANPKMVVNEGNFLRMGQGYAQHPLYNTPGTAMDRLKQFYDATMARKMAGTCGPSRLVR